MPSDRAAGVGVKDPTEDCRQQVQAEDKDEGGGDLLALACESQGEQDTWHKGRQKQHRGSPGAP